MCALHSLKQGAAACLNNLPPLAGIQVLQQRPKQPSRGVNKTRCVAIAVMVLGVISCLGFLVPGLWWGGLGGILAVVGSSVILCCSGSGASSSASSHMAAGALTGLAAIVHAVAVIVYIMFWANTVKAVGDDCDDGVYTGDGPNNGNLDCDALEGVASAFIGLLICPSSSWTWSPSYSIYAFQASNAIKRTALPTTGAYPATTGVPVAKASPSQAA